MIQGLRDLADNEQVQREIRWNYEYVIENFEELVGNFTNKWVVVDKEQYLYSDYNLDELLKHFRAMGSLTPSMVFVYAGNLFQGKPFVMVGYNIHES